MNFNSHAWHIVLYSKSFTASNTMVLLIQLTKIQDTKVLEKTQEIFLPARILSFSPAVSIFCHTFVSWLQLSYASFSPQPYFSWAIFYNLAQPRKLLFLTISASKHSEYYDSYHLYMWWNLNNLNGFSLDVHFAVNQLNKFPSTVNCINFHLQFKLSTEVLPYAFQATIVNAQFLYVNFSLGFLKKSKFFAARYADTKKSHLYLVIKSRHRII